MLKWSLHQLSDMDKPVRINRKIDLSKDLTSRGNNLVLSAQPARVKALIRYSFGKAVVTAQVRIGMTVPSSRSLVPVRLPLSFRFQEVYVNSHWALKRYEKEHPHGDTVLMTDHDGYFDFNKAVADNIILQIPTKVLSKQEARHHLMPKGHGWEVVSEDDYQSYKKKAESKQVDPRLAKLKDYFSNQKK